jgi:hypothetical protein
MACKALDIIRIENNSKRLAAVSAIETVDLFPDSVRGFLHYIVKLSVG